MGYREKSAWVMGAVMVAAGLYYLKLVLDTSGQTAAAAPPTGVLIGYVVLVVVCSIIAQATLASVSSSREANAPADERERPVLDQAGNWSGYVLGAGAVAALGYFLVHADGLVLFHMIMGSLIASQIAEYAFQILLLRRSA